MLVKSNLKSDLQVEVDKEVVERLRKRSLGSASSAAKPKPA